MEIRGPHSAPIHLQQAGKLIKKLTNDENVHVKEVEYVLNRILVDMRSTVRQTDTDQTLVPLNKLMRGSQTLVIESESVKSDLLRAPQLLG